ncbi:MULTISPECIES: 4Fe-4S binding protein [environmental samples]|uniref:4Fe-4S binding protein n=1 Tax=environmental samples TaxID=876090 RepID=UPI000339F881|nr:MULTISPECIES: 4Fe-4S binding protein [environmental samples]CDC70431.1 4Fe-4S ferredoxin iron-sulfur binding protein [Oscillibacter sp. CAG:155]
MLVCVYGNRAYEDTLVELEDTAKQAGFQVIAAVAAIAEHSIAHRYAAGRPDAEDAKQLQAFAGKIQEKLSFGNCAEPKIPGNRPYKKAGGSGMVPKPTKECTNCGLCAKKCPVQAIDPSDPKRTDKDTCISCMRCVSVCPQSARKVNSALLAAVDMALKKVCSDRKEGELYI